jgi:hypothetical protein
VRPAECDCQPKGPSRNCQPPAAPRFGQARKPRADGAKRSGLTELRTAGQSRVVMTAMQATVAHVSEHARAIEARWWKVGRRRRASAAAVRNSERVRAHPNERVFPAKPDTRVDWTGAA